MILYKFIPISSHREFMYSYSCSKEKAGGTNYKAFQTGVQLWLNSLLPSNLRVGDGVFLVKKLKVFSE
ncbi:MAG: hypothetical protein DRP76_00965 [Candidatus Omnitrophota bacterium]|nr:MAG: hypothetical protein DRP76_00965 [Candidatus Omnitrophota bacterium]